MPTGFHKETVLALILLIYCSQGSAMQSLSAQINYSLSRSEVDYLDQSVQYARQLNPWTLISVGAGVSQTAWKFRSIGYKFEGDFVGFPQIQVGIRLTHKARYAFTSRTTTLLLRAKTHLHLGKAFFVLSSVGWYERFNQLKSSSVLPTLSEDPKDRDIAAELGFGVHIFDKLSAQTKIATFDDMDVANLNHPYWESKVVYRYKLGLQLFLLTRYAVFLGFGRRDRLLFGSGIAWDWNDDFTPVFSIDS